MAEQASLLPNGRQQFISANGDPLVGGEVYMYAVGTETPITTWQDPLMTTPNTNPILLDDLGSASIYGVGSYRQVLYDALGNLLWDEVVDSGVNSNNAGGGGGGGGGVSGIGTSGTPGSTSSVGIYITNLPAVEPIALSAPVNIFLSGGAPAIRNANAALAYSCDGFAATAITTGALGTIYINGVVGGLLGLTAGTDYYLAATSGAISTTGATASGQLYQRVGKAVNNTSLAIDLSPVIQLS